MGRVTGWFGTRNGNWRWRWNYGVGVGVGVGGGVVGGGGGGGRRDGDGSLPENAALLLSPYSDYNVLGCP
ncbi:hypothetical protein M0804_014195 [Polistes exclamans]|nr:hypothetical protein M0804_014196 [Polistes exclamans]KAI4475614.1 hypothetical protein M0804_014195 [Polistes exclamans]